MDRAPGAGATALSSEGTAAEPVPTQLATVLAPAAHQPDGSYQVNIRLQPEDLGVVHVELHLEAGTVNVSLHAEGDATRDMLRQHLGQLRQQMASAGLSTGRFDVSGGTGSGGDGTGSRHGVYSGAATTNADQDGPGTDDTGGAAGAAEISPLTNGQLDVRL
jgi:flagellar hook-length control protein FliK